MKFKHNENGFTYIETIISLVILTVGLLGTISALTWGVFYLMEAEKKTVAKQFANSTVETIFAARDLQSQDAASIKGWNYVQIKKPDNEGIFIEGWYPVRMGAGNDAIYGTADDSCASGSSCSNNPEVEGYSRNIEINDIVENNVVRKRRVDVTVKYFVGSVARQEKVSTIIANLPFN